METYTGKSIFNGIATGKILFFQKSPIAIHKFYQKICKKLCPGNFLSRLLAE